MTYQQFRDKLLAAEMRGSDFLFEAEMRAWRCEGREPRRHSWHYRERAKRLMWYWCVRAMGGRPTQ